MTYIPRRYVRGESIYTNWARTLPPHIPSAAPRRAVLTVTDAYDSSTDPITPSLPPMVGFRLLDKLEIARAMGAESLVVSEAIEDLRDWTMTPGQFAELAAFLSPPCEDQSAAGTRRPTC